MSDTGTQPDVARTLVGGAAFSIVRLVAVVIAGLVGTVLLARLLGPHDWGVYAAGWSSAMLVGAVFVHGVRDALVATTEAGHEARSGAALLCAAIASAAAIVVAVALIVGVERDTLLLLLALGAWATAYPLRLPALVHVVRSVRPVRVMVLESLDAVIVPLAALAAYQLLADDLRAMALGVATSTALGLALAAAWQPASQHTGSLRRGASTLAAARHLTSYQLVAVGRELALPVLVLASCGSRAAGAFGIALPLGAMVSLGLAASAQPVYGALATMGGDLRRVARLTNIVRTLLGGLLVVAIPFVWLATPWVLPIVYGDAWEYATTTVMLVVTVFAVNAALVPWVNVLMVDATRHRSLVAAQGAATAVVLVVAAIGAGGTEAIAATFLVAQLAFGVRLAWLVRQVSPDFVVADAAWYVVAIGLGVAVTELVTPAPWLGIPVALVAIAASPARRPLGAALRRLRGVLAPAR